MAALDRLAATLGVDRTRLDALSGYSEEQLGEFEARIAAAMEREDAAFDAGLEDALRFVPVLLRPTAKKLLFGGGRRG